MSEGITIPCDDVTERKSPNSIRWSADEQPPIYQRPTGGRTAMTFPSPLFEAGFVLSRLLFGVVIGYLAVGNLLDLDQSIGYAEHKGVPVAAVSVPLGSLGLFAGALAVLTGIYPGVGALVVIGCLVPITGLMHDFWTLDGEDRQNERIHFLKNVGLIGTAVVFVALSTVPWPLAVSISIW